MMRVGWRSLGIALMAASLVCGAAAEPMAQSMAQPEFKSASQPLSPPQAAPPPSPELFPGEVLILASYSPVDETSASELPPEVFRRARPIRTQESPQQGRAEEARFEISIPWGEPSFEAFRKAYLSEGGKAWLRAVMDRAAPYLPYIMERIAYYRLPEELAYLPAIESEFSAKAVSKSGAMGLWQFMRNSIGGYGISIDDWVDERRDFMKSTDGALRKLADNYARLGDWHLALAAYNAGLGAINRASQAAGTRDYWKIREQGLLSKETSSYVPKFLAAASLLRYPGRSGISVSWNPPKEWETVELGKPLDLGLLAPELGLSLKELLDANAELRYSVTPPYRGYRLKVPAGQAATLQNLLNDPSRKLIRYHLHTVRSGDTLSGLSRDYEAPLAMILDANPGLRADLIKLGQVIVIPALKEGGARPKAQDEAGNLDFSGLHQVQKGESLWSISLRYDIQPEVLAEKNGLELSSVIREGTSLKVPILKP